MTKVYSDMRRLLRQKHCTAKSERGANIAHHSSSFMPGNSRCTYCFSSVFFFVFCFVFHAKFSFFRTLFSASFFVYLAILHRSYICCYHTRSWKRGFIMRQIRQPRYRCRTRHQRVPVPGKQLTRIVTNTIWQYIYRNRGKRRRTRLVSLCGAIVVSKFKEKCQSSWATHKVNLQFWQCIF